MFPLLFLLLTHASAPSIQEIDHLAASRNVTALNQLLTGPARSISPFAILEGGAYDVGHYGWHALPLRTVDGRNLVVLTTPLTSEDTGELVFERVGGKLEYIPEDTDEGIRIEGHDFDLRFNVPGRTADLTDDVAFKRLPSAGSSFLMRFSPCYKVLKITDNGKEVPFVQAGGVVSASTPNQGETFTYRIQYVGKVVLPNYAGSISDSEASLTNDYWYPMIMRQPATYRIRIHSPRDWPAVAQGELVETKILPDERVTEYRMDLPVTYYSVSAAPYKTYSQVIGGKRYGVWSLHMTPAQMKDETEFYAQVVDFYSHCFSAFPFSGYGLVVSDGYGGGGALEAYSFTTWGNVPGEDAHEPSHTWWGGIVDNSYLHSFWNESFADYCQDMYKREVPIGNHAERELAYISTAHPTSDWDQATLQDSGVEYGPIAGSLGYGKGAYVLYMLEQEIGLDGMLKAMRTWLADHPKDRSGEWQDFEAAVDKSTGKDYTWFFDQWLRSPGAADLGVMDLKWANGILSGRFTQEGRVYRMPVEVLIDDASGHRRLETVRTDGAYSRTGDSYVASQLFEIPCPAKPTLVSFDPWMKLLRHPHPDEARPELNTFEVKDVYRDPAQPGFSPQISGNLKTLPVDLAGLTIVGSPETLPAMRPLCLKAGFVVNGNRLTYHGITVDLTASLATSLVDVGGGRMCRIVLGHSDWPVDFGHAETAVADRLGRFLDGHTEPKLSGYLTFRM